MNLARELTRLLGPDAVSVEPATLAIHASDKWFASREPDGVFFAHSTADVSKLLRFANRRGIPVTPRGAGIGYVGGCVPARGGIALSVARMDRIKEINFADAVAVVERAAYRRARGGSTAANSSTRPTWRASRVQPGEHATNTAARAV